MTKHFAVEINGTRQEFTARQDLDARYAVQPYVDAYGFDGVEAAGVRCFVKGDEVSAQDYLEACAQRFDDWYAKKLETHKRVRVLHGTSIACYVWKWVRK